MGGTKIKAVDMSESIDQSSTLESSESEVKVKKSNTSGRSKRYTNLRSQVDKTISYDLTKAIELVKKLSSKNHKSITADLTIKEAGTNIEVDFPYPTGKTVRVAIVDDKLIAGLEKGIIDFDILVAAPEMMGKVAKFARVLGPKGLMPNPKNKTVTPDPEKRKKELEAGKVNVKSEKKAPLIHLVIGNRDQDTNHVAANVMALVKQVGLTQVKKLVLSSTMSPGVRVNLSDLTTAE